MIYLLGGLWRLGIAHLTQLLPSFMETSLSLRATSLGLLYMWLDHTLGSGPLVLLMCLTLKGEKYPSLT
jgi:hypothetical protein